MLQTGNCMKLRMQAHLLGHVKTGFRLTIFQRSYCKWCSSASKDVWRHCNEFWVTRFLWYSVLHSKFRSVGLRTRYCSRTVSAWSFIRCKCRTHSSGKRGGQPLAKGFPKNVVISVRVRARARVSEWVSEWVRERESCFAVQPETRILRLFLSHRWKAGFQNSARLTLRPPLWSSGQSSRLQIQRPGLDSRHYQIFWEAVGLERGLPSLVSIIEELLRRKPV
jgi:hypothetical protein